MLANEEFAKNDTSRPNIKDNIVIGKELIADKNSNFGTTILDTLSRHANIIGMVDAETGEKTTFAEMKDRSVRCAIWLRKQGVGENDVVGLSSPVQMNDYVPYLATLYINAIVNPWHYDASVEQAQHFIGTCRPKVIFACDQSIDKLVEIAKTKGVNCQFVTYSSHPTHQSLQDIMSKQTQQEVDNFKCTVPLDPRKKVSQIIFSSGTTSTPKAIMLSYHSLLARQMEESGVHVGMTCLWYSTFAWITCGIFTLSCIRLCCTRVVHRAIDVESTAKFVEKYKINFIFLRSYLLTLCQQAKVFTRYDFSSVETILYAGTKINKGILEQSRKNLPDTFVRGSYGTTEAGCFISRQINIRKNVDSAGHVFSGVRLKIVDPNSGVVLGPNQEGEIYFKTDNAMLGYLNNPVETRKVMDEEGWVQSGDLGYYDETGEIFICDRLKAIIKTKFYTISSFEFEDTLSEHPAVDDCAVVGVEHPIDVERPFIFIIKAHDVEVTPEELIEFAASKNERYRVIGGLTFVDKIPYTQNGKKHLRKLQEMAKTYIAK